MVDSGRSLKTFSQPEAWVLEVERAVRNADPGAFPVARRVLNRVLRIELEVASSWARLPHRKAFAVPRDRLLWLVAPDELGVSRIEEISPRVILLARPEEAELRLLSPPSLTEYYARLLFHSRIDEAWSAATESGRITLATVQERITRLGQVEFDELSIVLDQEGMLYRPDDRVHVYGEFQAWFQDHRRFAPGLLPHDFPSLRDLNAVDQLLREDLDPDAIAAQLQLDRLLKTGSATGPVTTQFTPPSRRTVSAASRVSAVRARRYLAKADRLLKIGNQARAIRFEQLALEATPVSERLQVIQRQESTVALLVARIGRLLALDECQVQDWTTAILKLLPTTVLGFWNNAARMLADIERACFESEQETYRLDLWGWIWSRGSRPLKQPLPDMPLVLICKRLKSAMHRLPRIELSPELRQSWHHLLEASVSRAEGHLRERLQPAVTNSLREVGVVPQGELEELSFEKEIQELLDLVVERGYVTMGDLRDSLARGHFKLNDLASPQEFLSGDLLLKADSQLSKRLPATYHGGPFYLRWLQRFNSVVFGTPIGRTLTMNLALPFGGSYLALEGLQHMVEPVCKACAVHAPHLLTRETWLFLGFIFLFLIHSETGRRYAWKMAIGLGQFVKFLLWDLPIQITKWPFLQSLLRSMPVVIARRYVMTPLMLTLLFGLILPRLELYSPLPWWGGMLLFLGTTLLLNSRLGRDTEELTAEWFSRTWYQIRVNVFVALFQWIVDLFRAVLDVSERILYAVDEWLRFHSSESRFMLAIKAAGAGVWSIVHGVIRFCVTLLIEPQINPIKHFPVVTVSHKLILSYFAANHKLLSAPFVPLIGPWAANMAVPTIATAIPGVFGFLAWELKENWRLYRANRPNLLKPVRVGHHGETLARLLRPGFHSGTVPKLFARKRRALRKYGMERGSGKAAKFDEALHHVILGVSRFVERDLLSVLRQSEIGRAWELELADVRLGVNRIDVCLSQKSQRSFWIRFSEQSGWLVAGIDQGTWLEQATPEMQAVLHSALAGFYRQGAVDLVREQLEAWLPNHRSRYDIHDDGIVVWTDETFSETVTYNLQERPTLIPRPRAKAQPAGLTLLAAEDVLFSETPIALDQWSSFLEITRNTPDHNRRIIPLAQLLPASSQSASN